MNICGVLNNLDQLLILVQEKKPSVIFLAETHLTENIGDQEVYIKGYKTIRCDSHSTHTGGVIIYVKNRISYVVTSNFSEAGNWFLSIKIIKGFRNGNYGVIYHSPSSSNAVFLSSFESWYESTFSTSNFNIVFGDFNIDLAKQTTYSDKLVKLINFLGLKQIVNDFTRVTKNSQTKIDLIITNEYSIKSEVLNTFIISDHRTIIINGLKNMITETEFLQEISSWKNYTKIELQSKLSKFNWNLINEYSLKDKTNMFNSLLLEAVNSLVVKKTIKTKNINKWYSEDLNDLRIVKDKSFETFNFIKSVR